MKVLEILSEAFEYKQYIPTIKKIVKEEFQSAIKEGQGVKAQINLFLNQVSNRLDDEIMADILKKYPMSIGSTAIRTLSVSFRPEYLRQEELPYYLAVAGDKAKPEWIRTRILFLRDADFHAQLDSKQALINITTDMGALAKWMFQQDDPKSLTAAFDGFTTRLIGLVFHEVKHHVQRTKSGGFNNKFYTGDYRDPRNAQRQYKTKAGYWLNADEIDSWATTIASEIHNIYGNDMERIKSYLNASAQGKQMHTSAGLPASTTLNHYHDVLFNKRTRTNTDKTEIWRRILKKVYKELSQF